MWLCENVLVQVMVNLVAFSIPKMIIVSKQAIDFLPTEFLDEVVGCLYH